MRSLYVVHASACGCSSWFRAPWPGRRPGLQPIRKPSHAKARRVSFVVQPSGWGRVRHAEVLRSRCHVERRRSRSRYISACCRRRTAGIRPRSLDRLGMTAGEIRIRSLIHVKLRWFPPIFSVPLCALCGKNGFRVQGSAPFPGTKKGTPRGVPFRKANV